MNFIIAGGVLLAMFLVGTSSYLAVPYIERNIIEEQEELQMKYNTPLVISCDAVFSKEHKKQWIFVLILSIFCAIVTFRFLELGIGFLELFRKIGLSCVLFSVTIIDQKTYRIPNVLILIMLIMGFLFLGLEFIFHRDTFFGMCMMQFLGLICCLALFYVLAKLTKGGIGMGDVKLIAGMGWLLGISTTLFSILLSLLLCTITALCFMFQKKKTKNDSLPFGPFLFAGYMGMLVLSCL